MDKNEARQILNGRLRELRELSYERLIDFQSPVNETVDAPSGKRYQLEVQAFWDNERSKTLRVTVSVDDGGWRAFVPMTGDFIMAPDGSFVGE